MTIKPLFALITLGYAQYTNETPAPVKMLDSLFEKGSCTFYPGVKLFFADCDGYILYQSNKALFEDFQAPIVEKKNLLYIKPSIFENDGESSISFLNFKDMDRIYGMDNKKTKEFDTISLDWSEDKIGTVNRPGPFFLHTDSKVTNMAFLAPKVMLYMRDTVQWRAQQVTDERIVDTIMQYKDIGSAEDFTSVPQFTHIDKETIIF
jgi:hypothetical protein